MDNHSHNRIGLQPPSTFLQWRMPRQLKPYHAFEIVSQTNEASEYHLDIYENDDDETPQFSSGYAGWLPLCPDYREDAIHFAFGCGWLVVKGDNLHLLASKRLFVHAFEMQTLQRFNSTIHQEPRYRDPVIQDILWLSYDSYTNIRKTDVDFNVSHFLYHSSVSRIVFRRAMLPNFMEIT